MLVWSRMKAQAATQWDKLALVCGNSSLSYAQFAAQAEHVAHQWLRQGLKPGDRIALHLRNGIELATAYYACFAAGFVAVPVNTRLIPAEIDYVLEHSGARAYVSQPELCIPARVPSLEFGFNYKAVDEAPCHQQRLMIRPCCCIRAAPPLVPKASSTRSARWQETHPTWKRGG